jgi:hypothetical protein
MEVGHDKFDELEEEKEFEDDNLDEWGASGRKYRVTDDGVGKAAREFAEIGTHVLSIVDKNLKDISSSAVLQSKKEQKSKNPADREAEAFSNERSVMYYKMKADYHRYLAEFAPEKNNGGPPTNFPASRRVEIDCALSAYKIALSLAQDTLPAAHHLTILVAHNFSTFYYTMRRSTRMACHVAKAVYENACERLHELEGAEKAETTRVLQLLRENISQWTLDIARGNYDSDGEDSDVEIDEDLDDVDRMAQTQIEEGGNPLEDGSLLQVTAARVQQKPMGMHGSTNIHHQLNLQRPIAASMATLSTQPMPDEPGASEKTGVLGIKTTKPSILKRSKTVPNLLKPEYKVSDEAQVNPRMPDHQIMSYLAGFEGHTTTLDLDPEGKSLVAALHELFHSYLEGSSATPVSGAFSRKGVDIDKLWDEGKTTKGPRLYVRALIRMLKNFEIIPKHMEAGTVENIAAFSANAANGIRNTEVCLRYYTKYMLKGKRGGKADAGMDEVKTDPGRLIVPEDLSFPEFVDTLGRIGIIVIRCTPGYEQKYGNQSKEIINGFFQDCMRLYDPQVWRKMVQRPWEAVAKEKAALRPRPGSGKQLVALATEAAGLPVNLNYLSADFHLSLAAGAKIQIKSRYRALRQIFDFYRKVKTLHKVSQLTQGGRGRDVLFSQIATVSEVINPGEMMKFLTDFQVCPNLIPKRKAEEIFLAALSIARRGARVSKNAVGGHGKDEKKRPVSGGKNQKETKSSEGDDDELDTDAIFDGSAAGSGMGATFATFISCIERFAILADSETQEFSSDQEKVEQFLLYLELDQSDRWRAKMKVFGAPKRAALSRSATVSNLGGVVGNAASSGKAFMSQTYAADRAPPRNNRLLPKLGNVPTGTTKRQGRRGTSANRNRSNTVA